LGKIVADKIAVGQSSDDPGECLARNSGIGKWEYDFLIFPGMGRRVSVPVWYGEETCEQKFFA